MRQFRLSTEVVGNLLINIINEYAEPIGRTTDLDTATNVCILVINIIR